MAPPTPTSMLDNKDIYHTLDAISSSSKDLLALHNGAWSQSGGNGPTDIGQEKIIRAFAELMRNMARMKQFIRPSMCECNTGSGEDSKLQISTVFFKFPGKPYGKQSESLQKTLMDTIQIVQTLRSYLPPPHIPVSSWKCESGGTSSITPTTPGLVGGVTSVTAVKPPEVSN